MPIFSGTAAADRLVGSAEADQLYGLDGNDLLYGVDGDDWLVGGLGNDTMVGGLGNDSYDVDSASDVVVERAGEGIDRVRAWVSYQLAANVETLTLAGTADLVGTGNALDNTIVGNAGNNVLNGSAGNDVLIGGKGDDVYDVDSAGDKVVEAAGEGHDRVRSLVSFTLGANVEDLTLGGTGDLIGVGNALNNTIIGNAGNNVLHGGAGDDVLIGRAGDDVYDVDSYGDKVIEAAGEGHDRVRTSLDDYVLPANVEDLAFTGAGGHLGYGNALDNVIIGNAGNDLIFGGAGNDVLFGNGGNDFIVGMKGDDTMVGGAGDDQYDVDSAGDRVRELAGEGIDLVHANVSFALSANIENLTLEGSQSINGFGNDLANTIIGNGGNNVLHGGAGDDVLIGHAGNDVYDVDSSGDQVQEAAGEGYDRVRASVDYTLSANVEELDLVGTMNIDGTGNELANTIVGNAGVNSLDGGAGNDVLLGGAGDDFLSGRAGIDILRGGDGNDTLSVDGTPLAGEVYDGGAGMDTLWANGDLTVASVTNIEILFTQVNQWVQLSAEMLGSLTDIFADEVRVSNGGMIDLTDAVDVSIDRLKLSDVGNTLDISGIRFGPDLILGGNGSDIIHGGSTSNTIDGQGGDDVIFGGVVGDFLTGGAGNDKLTGGSGPDDFIYISANNGVDTITDFNNSQGDTLEFRGALHGNFSYIGAEAFTVGGHTEARFSNGQVLIDTDGNGIADITINLTGITDAAQLSAFDFIFS